MEIFLNGEVQQLNENANLAELIKQLALENQRLAIEINGQIISRSRWASHHLSLGDKVEIVRAIGGG